MADGVVVGSAIVKLIEQHGGTAELTEKVERLRETACRCREGCVILPTPFPWHKTLQFWKMNGAGNDFVMLDNRDLSLALSKDEIARLCDRHRGVGADGLLAVEPATNGARLQDALLQCRRRRGRDVRQRRALLRAAS